MKRFKLFLAVLIGINGFVFSQGGGVPTYQNTTGATDAEYNSLTGSANDISKIASFASVTDFDNISFAKVGVQGSNYLFDSWKNHALIVAGQKKYTINNINYNVRLQRFESQVEDNKSLFVYDLPSISSMTINGRQFISLFNYKTNSNIIYEVIHKDDTQSLLKSYNVKVVQGSPNPMVNRKKHKIKKDVIYFMKKGDNLSKIKLNKKGVLKALSVGNENITALESFVKDNKMSYKNEADLKKILAFAGNL